MYCFRLWEKLYIFTSAYSIVPIHWQNSKNKTKTEFRNAVAVLLLFT